jgi:hypothetical protein
VAARRTTFGKIQRDREKKAKALAKRDRRLERSDNPLDDDDENAPATSTDGGAVSEAEVIERLQQLHQRFDDGDIEFEDFEKQKADLLARLS